MNDHERRIFNQTQQAEATKQIMIAVDRLADEHRTANLIAYLAIIEGRRREGLVDNAVRVEIAEIKSDIRFGLGRSS